MVRPQHADRRIAQAPVERERIITLPERHEVARADRQQFEHRRIAQIGLGAEGGERAIDIGVRLGRKADLPVGLGELGKQRHHPRGNGPCRLAEILEQGFIERQGLDRLALRQIEVGQHFVVIGRHEVAAHRHIVGDQLVKQRFGLGIAALLDVERGQFGDRDRLLAEGQHVEQQLFGAGRVTLKAVDPGKAGHGGRGKGAEGAIGREFVVVFLVFAPRVLEPALTDVDFRKAIAIGRLHHVLALGLAERDDLEIVGLGVGEAVAIAVELGERTPLAFQRCRIGIGLDRCRSGEQHPLGVLEAAELLVEAQNLCIDRIFHWLAARLGHHRLELAQRAWRIAARLQRDGGAELPELGVELVKADACAVRAGKAPGQRFGLGKTAGGVVEFVEAPGVLDRVVGHGAVGLLLDRERPFAQGDGLVQPAFVLEEEGKLPARLAGLDAGDAQGGLGCRLPLGEGGVGLVEAPCGHEVRRERAVPELLAGAARTLFAPAGGDHPPVEVDHRLVTLEVAVDGAQVLGPGDQVLAGEGSVPFEAGHEFGEKRRGLGPGLVLEQRIRLHSEIFVCGGGIVLRRQGCGGKQQQSSERRHPRQHASAPEPSGPIHQHAPPGRCRGQRGPPAGRIRMPSHPRRSCSPA